METSTARWATGAHLSWAPPEEPAAAGGWLPEQQLRKERPSLALLFAAATQVNRHKKRHFHCKPVQDRLQQQQRAGRRSRFERSGHKPLTSTVYVQSICAFGRRRCRGNTCGPSGYSSYRFSSESNSVTVFLLGLPGTIRGAGCGADKKQQGGQLTLSRVDPLAGGP